MRRFECSGEFTWGTISRVSCQKGPTRHAYAWQIGHNWQDTLDISVKCTAPDWNHLPLMAGSVWACQAIPNRYNKNSSSGWEGLRRTLYMHLISVKLSNGIIWHWCRAVKGHVKWLFQNMHNLCTQCMVVLECEIMSLSMDNDMHTAKPKLFNTGVLRKRTGPFKRSMFRIRLGYSVIVRYPPALETQSMCSIVWFEIKPHIPVPLWVSSACWMDQLSHCLHLPLWWLKPRVQL